MKKVILAFPDPTSLWLFKDQSKAVNITVTPGKNIIAGLFSAEEIALAKNEFKAAEMAASSTASNSYSAKTNMQKPLFRGVMGYFKTGLYQLRSLVNF